MVADDSVTRKYVVRTHNHSWTESVTWISVRIIGFGRPAMQTMAADPNYTEGRSFRNKHKI